MNFLRKPKNILGIDYGDKNVGLAIADSQIRIAMAHGTVDNDEKLIDNILDEIAQNSIDEVVIGYPRNQSGEPTQQTEKVLHFVEKLKSRFDKISFQDESLTSVLAEERLRSYNRPYLKTDIDSMSAVIILEDYMEINYAQKA